MLLLPCNLASVYIIKHRSCSGSGYQHLSVLYVVESGDTVHSIQDLAGKTVYSTGKGTTELHSIIF